jgi:hypothetical protein
MLTAAQLEALERTTPERAPRSVPSLKQQYHEYVMQRIEDYKDSLTRSELLKLGDEAATELYDGASGQLLLTEVLMQETVDQQIVKRLSLPSFRKWRSKILPLREAQRSPNRWGIASHDPVAVMLPRLEPGDRALVVGGGADRAAFLLAAHDLSVMCLFSDTATAGVVERTLASESLSGRCEVFVVALGGSWLPPIPAPVHLVVIDAPTVLGLPRDRQRALLAQAQQLTAAEGAHCVVSSDPDVAPEGCLLYYPNWQRLPLPHAPNANQKTGPGLRGVLLAEPRIPPTPLSLR